MNDFEDYYGMTPEELRDTLIQTNPSFDREFFLDEAKHIICHDRENQYGSPEQNFYTIADLWSRYLDYTIEPDDVAIMMCMLKIARIKTGKHKRDNWIDAIGYLACGAEIAEEQH